MGLVHAEIELTNANDVGNAKKHIIGEEEIRRITVSALVDSGSFHTAINENIQEYLQLPIVRKERKELADGTIVEFDIVSPLNIKFRDREITTSAVLLPGNSEVLLGVLPMEYMELLIDPHRQELVTRRPEWLLRI
jgi:clan AA aspartic protease